MSLASYVSIGLRGDTGYGAASGTGRLGIFFSILGLLSPTRTGVGVDLCLRSAKLGVLVRRPKSGLGMRSENVVNAVVGACIRLLSSEHGCCLKSFDDLDVLFWCCDRIGLVLILVENLVQGIRVSISSYFILWLDNSSA